MLCHLNPEQKRIDPTTAKVSFVVAPLGGSSVGGSEVCKGSSIKALPTRTGVNHRAQLMVKGFLRVWGLGRSYHGRAHACGDDAVNPYDPKETPSPRELG